MRKHTREGSDGESHVNADSGSSGPADGLQADFQDRSRQAGLANFYDQGCARLRAQTTLLHDVDFGLCSLSPAGRVHLFLPFRDTGCP